MSGSPFVRATLAASVFTAMVVMTPEAGAIEPDYADSYAYDTTGARIDLGVQPLGYPSGMFSSVMARDKTLRLALDRLGLGLRSHPYVKGFDMIQLLDGARLEGALLGDMPTILTAVSNDVAIIGMVKQTFSSIVAREIGQIGELKGKRIGNAAGSSAHHALLRGLRSAGLSETDVTLVAMGVEDMPDALAKGTIDAFAAWEPAPSIALRGGSQFKVVYRGVSTDYFVLTRALLQHHPEAARELIASFVRALNWMGSSREALLQSCEWAMADGTAFIGKSQNTTVEQAAAIVRREILEVASAPVIPKRGAGGQEMLESEFLFLKDLGKIPAGTPWSRVASSFSRDLLLEVLEKPGRYRLTGFDYDTTASGPRPK